jgi:hypothetical protein
MKTRFAFAWACALMMFAAPVFAGPTLTIRLVDASNSGKGAGGGLGDVAQLLKDNLPFNSFRLLANQSMPLPADGTVSLAAGIQARCSGDQRNLRVVIERGRKAQIQSTVELRNGVPLILGGLPSDTGKLIVILLVR